MIHLINRTHPVTKRSLAMMLKIVSFILYAWNDALSKTLTTQATPLSPQSVVFYQYALAACIMMPFMLTRGNKPQKQLVSLPLHCLRLGLCTVGIVSLNQSFTVMPLSYAVGFNLLSPCLTVACAYCFFQERLSRQKLCALVFAVLAYALLLDSAKLHTTTHSLQQCLLPTIALLCFQINTLVTKKLTQMGENNVNLTVFLCMTIPLALLPFEHAPATALSANQWIILWQMALNGALAALALHQAIAMVEVTFLLPFGFLKYGIVSFFGYLYFVEIPNLIQIIGIIMTMVALMIMNHSPKIPKHTVSV